MKAKAKRYKLTDKLRVFIAPADLKVIRSAANHERKSVSQFVRESSIRAALLVSTAAIEERKSLAAERQLGEGVL